MRTIIFDNEAVQALVEPLHPKHGVVIAHLAAGVLRRRKGSTVEAVVPTTVRVEAGWDRSDPSASGVNRLRVLDAPLDQLTADLAAAIARETRLGVTDAHVGAVARSRPGDVVILTSDPRDVVMASTPKPVTAIRV